ncbi:aea923be-eb16-4998-bfb9-11f02ef90806 [Thermothielavioides terrestris]|uniref:Aea923be-eb16-4998-bfb9-11f02ef90806 n=1 Tax=Thermothielavioides terrestris TaxID=2587410 RepID=A0A3S5CXC8_9PEZI|nr:aea923be-eb16-4998-bfb9-11f02ef90806 [Thermothielavioides terrestris]
MAFRATLPALSKLSPRPPPAPTSPTKTTILEVERKFRRLAVPSLTLNNSPDLPLRPLYRPEQKQPHTPHTHMFASVQPLPTRTIHDIYYDTPTRALAAAGAWVRRRDGAWQAKVRRGDYFVRSRFEELRGERDVGRCVAAVLGSGLGRRCGTNAAAAEEEEEYSKGEGGEKVVGVEEEVVRDFGLGKLAEFVTTREAWLVDGEFKVVRDRMDFGHEVGEVELQVEVEGGIGEGEKAVLMEEMDRRIVAFMRR